MSIPADKGTYDGTTGVTALLTTGAASPMVCSEQRGAATFGAMGSFVFSPSYNNATPGGLFEFDAGGPSVVDAGAVNYGFDSTETLLNVQQANTASTQVACYSINALGANNPMYADSSVSGDRVFDGEFEGGHRADEPWVSINTVVSPPTDSGHRLGYVMQIHNASQAVNWHMSLGYDHAFFSKSLNGNFSPKWCIQSTANHAQPGAVGETGELCADATTTHIFTTSDIQTTSNSIYVFVEDFGTSTAVSSWASLTSSFYAASGAVFAPPGVYAQRIDDKVSVAGNVNVPTQNIGNIVCANDPLATACTISDSDGAGIPSSITFNNNFTAGAVAVDPVAYVVDTGAGTTKPGTTPLAAPSNISCNDTNGILLGSLSFGTSTGPAGARALAFAFKPLGTLFVPGTATCQATFTANGISSTQSFNITMQQVNVSHFDVTVDNNSITAGDSVNATVTAKDGAGNVVPTYNGTVIFSSTDPMAVLPPSSNLTLGTGTFNVTLKKSGAQTITAKDSAAPTITGTSPAVSVSAASAASFTVQMLGSAEQDNPNTQVNVTPYDQYNNRVTSGYAGTVHFTSTDTAAILPADAAFTNGIYSMTFKTISPPDFTVTATDTATITGTSNPVTVVGD
ncbi:MAG TPA: hypothetical protein VH082_03830 [Rudaea sp.]|nr:hypothetical protein [Rudaea sp.]